MTKYEWESELKKSIHRLPADEIARIMEYYDELFADKIERGYNEYEIIGQFGNPVDVADKILSEYEGEIAPESASVPPPAAKRTAEDGQTFLRQAEEACREEQPVGEPPRASACAPAANARRTMRGERAAIVALVLLFTGFAPLLVVGTVWIVAAAVTVAGFACATGGAAATFLSLATVLRGAVGAGAAQAGMCLALCGIGIMLSILCCKGMKYLGKATAALFRVVKNWVYPLTETEVKA